MIVVTSHALVKITMVLKNVYRAAENTVFIEAESLWVDQVLSRMRREDFSMLSSLPEKILNEAREFIKRNSLVVVAYKVENRKPLHCCCARCLKAHLIKKCDELDMKKHKTKLSEIFRCETGHYGYYVDDSRLIKNSFCRAG